MKEKYVIYDNTLAEDDGLVTMLAIVSTKEDAQEFILDEAFERLYWAFLGRLQNPHWRRIGKEVFAETDEEIIEHFTKDPLVRWSWCYLYSKVPVMED